MIQPKWDELPVEVQEKILDEQELQIGHRDPSAYKRAIGTGPTSDGGFTWDESTQGWTFWNSVIGRHVSGTPYEERMAAFFERYPKRTNIENNDPLLIEEEYMV